MLVGINGTFNFVVVFPTEYNILIHQFYMLGVVGVFSGALFSAI
jgi:photosystem II P680 reaction center D1 protein